MNKELRMISQPLEDGGLGDFLVYHHLTSFHFKYLKTETWEKNLFNNTGKEEY